MCLTSKPSWMQSIDTIIDQNMPDIGEFLTEGFRAAKLEV